MRVDWFQLLVDLSRKGLSTRSIGDEVSVPHSTILGWKQGAEPKHVDGEHLIELWLRMTEKTRDEIPTTPILAGLSAG